MIVKDDRLVDSPLATILVLTYNQESMVGSTIESVVSQITDFEYEVLLVDDCSTDKTMQVCIEYQKKYPEKILFIENEPNKGIKRNFFESLSYYARGRYLAICGGDDWWCDTQKLQKQVDYLRLHKDYTMVHTRNLVWEDGTDLAKAHTTKISDRSIFDKLVVENGVSALTVCFTHESFDGFVKEIDPLNQSLPMDDYSMWIWHAYRGKIHMIDDVTAVYRVVKNSLSHSTNYKKMHHIETERREIKMFFLTHFGIKRTDLEDKIALKCYLDTLMTTDMVGDSDLRAERNKFFLKKHYYLFYLVGLLYKACGTNESMNKRVRLIDRVIRHFHPTHKYYI